MAVLKAALLAVLAAVLSAQTSLFPLSEIRPGLRGVGKTVFSGDRIEEFGVLENAGPKQAVILARLTREKVEAAGVLQGMSGSPV